MAKNLEERVIPKEDAIFWLDKNGNWCNENGKFLHKKIINYFHESIKKDKQGYYVGQNLGHICEKVYFRYEDTALFVFDMKDNTLILNTKQKVKLRPRNLYTKDDNLYMKLNDEIIKFSENALVRIAPMLDGEKDLYLKLKGKKYKIKNKI